MRNPDCMWVAQYRLKGKWRYCFHTVGMTKKEASVVMKKLRELFGIEYEYRLRKYIASE